MKILKNLFIAAFALVTICALAACGGEEHTPKAPVQENYKSATCTEGAYYDSVVYCADCGAELERNKFTVSDPLGHTEVTKQENRVEATCTEDGSYDSVVYCNTCGEEVSRTEKEILRSHKMANGKCSVCDLPESSEGLRFSLNSDGKSYTVAGIGSCTSTDIVIGVYNNLSVTAIGERAFSGCESLTSIVIGHSVTSIDLSAFRNCHKLVEIINKSSLNITKGSSDYGGLGNYALIVHSGESKIVNVNDCLFITSKEKNYLIAYVGNETVLTLPKSYNGESYQIYKYVFYNCDSLTSVIIPNNVTAIADYAFRNCSNLMSVAIGNSVTSIGGYAFYNCESLTSIKYRGTEDEWNAISKGHNWDSYTGNYTVIYNYEGE